MPNHIAHPRLPNNHCCRYWRGAKSTSDYSLTMRANVSFFPGTQTIKYAHLYYAHLATFLRRVNRIDSYTERRIRRFRAQHCCPVLPVILVNWTPEILPETLWTVIGGHYGYILV